MTTSGMGSRLRGNDGFKAEGRNDGFKAEGDGFKTEGQITWSNQAFIPGVLPGLLRIPPGRPVPRWPPVAFGSVP